MYIDAELITDETAVAEAILAGLADRMASALDLDVDELWQAMEGSPETSFAESVGIVIATACSMVQEKERDDFAAFGELILSTPRQRAEPATGTARWTFTEAGAHVVPDGSELVLDAADGTPVAFATVGESVAAAGLTVDAPIVALEPGLITSGLVGDARDYEAIPGVEAVTVVLPTTGGADEEERQEYLDRIARRARRVKVVPIITDDYADTALDHPAVAAAMAVRQLDLSAPTDPPSSPGHVTIYTRDALGGALSIAVKDEVRDMMQAEDRPLGVTIHMGNATITDLTIVVSAYFTADADVPATVAAIQAAIAGEYNPASYGIDEDAPGRWRPPRSTAEATVNEYDVAALIDDITGLAKIDSITVNGGSEATLTGWAPLPQLTAPATVNVL